MKKLTAILLLSLFIGFAQKPKTLKPFNSICVEVKEPSDICINPHNKESFFVVSDNGFLHEMDANGKILRTSSFVGLDFEAITIFNGKIIAVEEMARKLNVFDINNFEVEKSVVIPYGGGRNKGYEAITYNPVSKKIILITEKDPSWVLELDENLMVTSQFQLQIARDISAITFYKDNLWILSDEDRTIFKCDPQNYKVLESWKIPVVNPEGIVFNQNGELLILSDDRQKLYFFNLEN
ncbi:MAG: SdiA-regulated domain-containing protein [Flavobacterium sp.]